MIDEPVDCRPLHQKKKKSSLTVAGRNPRMVCKIGCRGFLGKPGSAGIGGVLRDP